MVFLQPGKTFLFMRDTQGFRLLNILSLDIVAGSVISALFFARLFDVKVLPYGVATLAITVWLIYTADHLLDAWSIEGDASTERHRFHQKYSTALLTFVVIALIADAILVFYIRPQVFKWGIILSTTVLAYLVIQRYLKFLKEAVIASLYTCGVLLPSITVTNLTVEIFHWTVIVQFCVLAFTNLLIFSWFDRELDWKHNQHSFVTFFGKKVTGWIIWIMIIGNLKVSIMMLLVDVKAEVIIMMMNICLGLVFAFRNRLKYNDQYRFLGDSIFLFPILYLL
jgi:hypothetical protein